MSQRSTIYKPRPCLCGCGELTQVRVYSRKQNGGFSYAVGDYMRGHGRRGNDGFRPEIYMPHPCICGCGIITQKFRGRFTCFIKGHENIGRSAWNKGKKFSEETKVKMSIARLGKEPANKVSIDLLILRRLYIHEGKTAMMVSKELGASYDAVKNRIRKLGWGRSTKESCSIPLFRAIMRRIRIAALSSPKAIESPNKLEQLVHRTADDYQIPHKRQVPLFGKFVVDVLFPQRSLVLEIFGRYWHSKETVQKKIFQKRNI